MPIATTQEGTIAFQPRSGQRNAPYLDGFSLRIICKATCDFLTLLPWLMYNAVGPRGNEYDPATRTQPMPIAAAYLPIEASPSSSVPPPHTHAQVNTVHPTILTDSTAQNRRLVRRRYPVLVVPIRVRVHLLASSCPCFKVCLVVPL